MTALRFRQDSRGMAPGQQPVTTFRTNNNIRKWHIIVWTHWTRRY